MHRYRMKFLAQLDCWAVIPEHYVPEKITRVDALHDHEIECVYPGDELDILYVNLLERNIPLDIDLPVFSDKEPEDKIGIWSWDDMQMIAGLTLNELDIVVFSDSYEV